MPNVSKCVSSHLTSAKPNEKLLHSKFGLVKFLGIDENTFYVKTTTQKLYFAKFKSKVII